MKWTIQNMKFLIVESSPFHIIIHFDPKYSPHDPVGLPLASTPPF